ncbi:hypothetical protein F4778DRAFT_181710 [Xylariomycetidae sp. FL2044]|nr:hypothetical protein F4778DRAFT_181710 [Xylariomycetidae sp. FL2044]
MDAPIDPATWAALDHRRNIGPIIGISVLCMVLATTAVTLRLYTRRFILKQVGPDDYLAVASLAGMLLVGIFECVHSQYGLGSHIWDVQAPEGVIDFFKFFYLGIIFYNVTLLFIKLALFFQYYRIVRQVSRYRFVYIGIMCLVVCWSVSQIFVMVFQCRPIYAYWDKTAAGTCAPEAAMQALNGAGNIATDIIVLLLPMPVVWRLGLKKAQKRALVGIFGLGFFTCIVSTLRLVFMLRVSRDITFDGVAITAWSVAELASGITCAALPTLRPLIGKYFPAFGTMAQSSGSRNYKVQSDSSASGKYSRSRGEEEDLEMRRRPEEDRGGVPGGAFDSSETELQRPEGTYWGKG